MFEILGELKDTRAIDPLIMLLQDRKVDWFVRASAASALGEIRDNRAIEPLISVAQEYTPEGDNFLRKYVAQALGKFNDIRIVEPLLDAYIGIDDRSFRDQIIYILGRVEVENIREIHVLSKFLEIGDDEIQEVKIREKAIYAMEKLRNIEALIPLKRLLSKDEHQRALLFDGGVYNPKLEEEIELLTRVIDYLNRNAMTQ
jgi:HEAT repeat protein